MADTNRLNSIIKQRGIKKGVIAKRLGITHNTLTNKLDGSTDFKVSEAQALCKILGITDPEEKCRIFFRG